MIVVIGIPAWQTGDTVAGTAAGLAADIARAAATEGGRVELLGKTGDDRAGDALLLDLAAAGVGHVALLRDAAHPTPVRVIMEARPGAEPDPGGLAVAALLAAEPASAEPAATRASNGRRATGAGGGPSLEAADIELGLRYLVDPRVIIVSPGLDERAARAVAEAAAFAGSHVVAIVVAGDRPSEALADATVLEMPPDDPDASFARLVGVYAAGLDRGVAPAEAFRAAIESRGWEPAG